MLLTNYIHSITIMQKFEDSFEGAYQSNGKKISQTPAKKTKIIINVSGISRNLRRDTIRSR